MSDDLGICGRDTRCIRQTVSKWENGSSDPSTTNLIALANLFDITPEEMLKEIR